MWLGSYTSFYRRYAVVVLVQGPPAPMAVLELMGCKCGKTFSPGCSCLTNNFKCTEMYKLQTCTNQRVEDEDEVAFTLDYDDYDDDDYD